MPRSLPLCAVETVLNSKNVFGTSGLVRQYFPKGTDFAKLTAVDVQRVENLLNNRPRKALNYHSPNEAFAKITTPPKIYALGM